MTDNDLILPRVTVEGDELANTLIDEGGTPDSATAPGWLMGDE